jgi:hypothetical protein
MIVKRISRWLTFSRSDVALMNQRVQIERLILQLRELRILQIFSRGSTPRQNQLNALIKSLRQEPWTIQMLDVLNQILDIRSLHDELPRDFAQKYVLLHRTKPLDPTLLWDEVLLRNFVLLMLQKHSALIGLFLSHAIVGSRHLVCWIAGLGDAEVVIF